MPTHPLRCSCGAVEGTIDPSDGFYRMVCYCDDCQAYAHALGRADEILDPRGGTDVTQLDPGRLTLTAGREHLACLRLTDKGLLRWHTRCCRSASAPRRWPVPTPASADHRATRGADAQHCCR